MRQFEISHYRLDFIQISHTVLKDATALQRDTLGSQPPSVMLGTQHKSCVPIPQLLSSSGS